MYKVTTDFQFPVREHYFILRPEPYDIYSDCSTVISSDLGIIPFARGRDSFGNITLTGFEKREHIFFSYETTFSYPENYISPPDKAGNMFFSAPSKYTKISAEMKIFAKKYSTSAEMCRAVFEYMEYTPNVTDINTTASVAFSQRQGVCQDYAHILIALLRYSGFNAIYVKGFKGEKTEQGVSHAWIEVLENGNRIAYDATDPTADVTKYIKVGIGRDFGDCPMERGVFLGGGLQSQKIELKITD